MEATAQQMPMALSSSSQATLETLASTISAQTTPTDTEIVHPVSQPTASVSPLPAHAEHGLDIAELTSPLSLATGVAIAMQIWASYQLAAMGVSFNLLTQIVYSAVAVLVTSMMAHSARNNALSQPLEFENMSARYLFAPLLEPLLLVCHGLALVFTFLVSDMGRRRLQQQHAVDEEYTPPQERGQDPEQDLSALSIEL